MTRRTTTLTVASLLLVSLVCVAFLLPVPYVTFEPGPAINTLGSVNGKPLIEIDGDVKTYPTDGELDLTTVSVTRPGSRVGLGQAFQAWFDSDVAILPRDIIYPPEQTDTQSEEQTAAQMATSQLTSKVAALRAAGYRVPAFVEVVSVESGTPADGSLQVGDRIVSVDGERTPTPQQVVDAVTAVQPGDPVTIEVERKGSSRTYTIRTEASPDDPSAPRVGIGLGENFDLPFTVTNNVSEAIGGPSAGSIFALAIYDKLTPGALTGDEIVAGTGEITADGTIGAIGGIQQKIVGAFEAGATVFLVPEPNCAEALGASVNLEQMRLVEVTDLQEAVTSLESLADDPQADVPTCDTAS